VPVQIHSVIHSRYFYSASSSHRTYHWATKPHDSYQSAGILEKRRKSAVSFLKVIKRMRRTLSCAYGIFKKHCTSGLL